MRSHCLFEEKFISCLIINQMKLLEECEIVGRLVFFGNLIHSLLSCMTFALVFVAFLQWFIVLILSAEYEHRMFAVVFTSGIK